ncbi:hypothetical protein ASF84_13220 [Pseudomonas sp. Leaf127]|uniref:hypothetical protein n=1 Tax=Pseudomonas sp. Leaf127 TaxID=1736267 RepID=UPI000702CD33|nr:hypothetical protein [Pseudomonas sp. Leaf127]KQQ56243.1 hypothetical protein ASF84_13220 [Pseudomonas sp. Leaf127]
MINEIEAGRLELEALASKLYVHIPSGATLVGDMVTLYWVGAGELGSFRDRFPVSARNVNADLKFEINNSVLQVNARRLVKVYYTLTRLINGRSVVLRSPELMFFIGNAQEQDAFAESGWHGCHPSVTGTEWLAGHHLDRRFGNAGSAFCLHAGGR